jgi:hypothetical protein
VLAFATGLGAPGAAQADYFVRPVLQYGGSLQDGLALNGASSGSATFYDSGTALEAHVDLADGTIKTYLSRTGPSDAFTGATGVMGDVIRYTGPSDVAVSFKYDFNVDISVDQEFLDIPPGFDARHISIAAYFAVFEAGTGANWAEWTVFSDYADAALYNDYASQSFTDEPSNFFTTYSGSLGTDLFLESGKSYEIYSAFNLLVTPGSMPGTITLDSLHTSTIGITPPAGSLITSQSGQFLGFALTPAAAVPEPATWAMLIVGFGVIGAASRRRNALCAA